MPTGAAITTILMAALRRSDLVALANAKDFRERVEGRVIVIDMR